MPPAQAAVSTLHQLDSDGSRQRSDAATWGRHPHSLLRSPPLPTHLRLRLDPPTLHLQQPPVRVLERRRRLPSARSTVSQPVFLTLSQSRVPDILATPSSHLHLHVFDLPFEALPFRPRKPPLRVLHIRGSLPKSQQAHALALSLR